MAIECKQFCKGNERCEKCKCSHVDYNGYITGLLQVDEEKISRGRFFLGRWWPLADDHVARIRKATKQRIDIFKSGVAICNIEKLTA